MRAALHAEWTKIRTSPGTVWLLLAIIALSIGVSALASSAVHCCAADPAKTSLTGVEFGQAVVAILAVFAISGEYGTGMITLTLSAMPRRSAMLAAKAAVLAGLVFAAGVVAVLISLLLGRMLLNGNGFAVSLTDGAMLRAAFGSVLYLVLVGWLSLGLATLVREAALAAGLVLALLYLFPVVAQVFADPDWYKRLQQIGPMTAGLAIQNTVNPAGQPIAPWAGLGVLAAWAAGSLLFGGLALELRDA